MKCDENQLANIQEERQTEDRIKFSRNNEGDWQGDSGIPIQTSKGSKYSSSTEGLIFSRTWSERKTGPKRLDIYYKTSTGKTLRSKNELKEFCMENNLPYDIDKFNFSTKDKIIHSIVLNPKGNEKKEPEIEETPEDLEPEIPEASCGEILGEAFFTDVKIPRSAREALRNPEAKKWKEAMDSEIKTMLERKVWSLVPKPEDARIIGNRWVYNTKKDSKGNIKTFKARLVALGNNQCPGLDYEETYSPVVNFSLIRFFLYYCL